jgi:hypothetical protein
MRGYAYFTPYINSDERIEWHVMVLLTVSCRYPANTPRPPYDVSRYDISRIALCKSTFHTRNICPFRNKKKMARNFDKLTRAPHSSKFQVRGGYKRSCGKSNSPAPLTGKFTTPRRENRKIRHEIKILKASKQAPHVYKLQIYRMTPKNILYHKILGDYPFKGIVS